MPIQLGRRVTHPDFGRGEVVGSLVFRGKPVYRVRFCDGNSWRNVRMTLQQVYWKKPPKRKPKPTPEATEDERRMMREFGLTLKQVREAMS